MSSTSGVTASEGPEDILRRRGTAQQKSTLETQPSTVVRSESSKIPNTPLAASIISFSLGALFILGVLMFSNRGLQSGIVTWQLGFFVAAWAAFHWGEFAVTAGWNREKCSVDSFLLENGMHYHAAHSIAILEYTLTVWLKPSLKAYPYISAIGIALVVLGQFLRSAAMIHAARSFSHTVAWSKLPNHVLVKDGIYSWSRHPSYAGFFYWALGTQLVLQNPISFLGYAVVLWRFFNARIKYEERHLVRFFGQDYEDYRTQVGTKIPFIP
ncbi:protein-s-isoprenylcysteine O-methyltransferase [Irpex rosettiformis]|uniref:Protein-s-isoprenylcysteine O-methyltransferase n=1 Tax=Irpex rosettiformis TaxID=378272 RepID=A0ACB8UEM0_9APHY|nr:protein-s-isoprenylcysteine O-methyltransferase [Irpex rosettiformis]